ncbi:MAG: hypothetical protein AABW53_01650 [Nanoarchaeota archaeon]
MATKTSLEQRTVKPIVLGNLALDGEAVRDANGNYLIKSQSEWMSYLAGSGKRLPTLPEYFAFIHHLQKENHPASAGLLQDLVKGGLCTGTQFCYYRKNAITHFGDETLVIPCTIPKGSGYLDELVGDNNDWRKVVQIAFGHNKADEVMEVLQRLCGERPYIWTSSAESRKESPEGAVWLGILTDSFLLYCGSSPIIILGRARRVRKKTDSDQFSAQKSDSSSDFLRRQEGCEAPRAENGSAYRTPAKTQEEVLDEKLSEIMGTFRQLKSPAIAEIYDRLEQQVLQKLKELYSQK